MTPAIVTQIALLRLSIGFLGEQQQYGWWSSQFFSPSSSAFLNPVFGRSSFLTRYYGVRDAAARVHDEYIGIGKSVFHLFRLPETVERDLHVLISDNDIVKELYSVSNSTENAEQFLVDNANKDTTKVDGPIRLGSTTDLGKKLTWQKTAQYYLQAFRSDTKVFPFVSEKG